MRPEQNTGRQQDRWCEQGLLCQQWRPHFTPPMSMAKLLMSQNEGEVYALPVLEINFYFVLMLVTFSRPMICM